MNRIISALFLSLTAAAAFPVLAADAPATPAGETKGDKVQLAPDAPDSYTVVKGDTLWGISGMFLKQPWRWPEVWRLNKDQIRNPHLIYPGQIIVLDRNGPYLSVGKQVGTSGDTRLSPQVYATPADSPIASIPMDLIRQFLVEPVVEEVPDDASKPTLVAVQDDRVLAGTGDIVFAKNLTPGIESWQIYRRAEPLRDPVTNQILAYETVVTGTAQALSPSEGNKAAVLKVTKAKREINIGMRLAPTGKDDTVSLTPHSAPANLNGKVLGITDGVFETGRMGVISLGVGKNDGVVPGHVFALHRNRGQVRYTLDGRPETWELPEDRYGLVFVFRVFNRVSYALVVESNNSVRVGDDVRAP